jgi:hypothetical protein
MCQQQYITYNKILEENTVYCRDCEELNMKNYVMHKALMMIYFLS